MSEAKEAFVNLILAAVAALFAGVIAFLVLNFLSYYLRWRPGDMAIVVIFLPSFLFACLVLVLTFRRLQQP